MIWNTAALALLLSSGASAAAPTAADISKAMKQLRHAYPDVAKTERLLGMKEMHQRVVAKLTKRLLSAPRQEISEDFDRSLLDNDKFLNWAYSSNEDCSEPPFSYDGYGMGGCVPSGTSSSYKIACSGAQTDLDLTMIQYNSTVDCSGDPSATLELTGQDGTCGGFSQDDDLPSFADDDDGFLAASSFTLSCDSARGPVNTFYDASGYNDADCQLLTAYEGLMSDRCVPAFPGFAYIKFLESCDIRVYSDDACEDEFPVSDDGDDYDDDNYSGSYGNDDDDNEIVSGECTLIGDPTSDDDFFYGQYGVYVTDFCVSDDGGDDDACFAGSETVLTEFGVTKSISDVEVGDKIQVVSSDGSLKFSEVVFLPHGANTKIATFSELEMASGNSLRATPSHFVLAGACGAEAFELTAMRDISLGSCVQTANGEDEVVGNGLVTDHGIYTIVTKESSGLVVVNGVRASSFAHNHWLVNNYYNIHRALYEVAPSLMKNRDVIAANLIVGDIALSL